MFLVHVEGHYFHRLKGYGMFIFYLRGRQLINWQAILWEKNCSYFTCKNGSHTTEEFYEEVMDFKMIPAKDVRGIQNFRRMLNRIQWTSEDFF